MATMGLVLIESMERMVMVIMFMTVMVMVVETVDMGIITKRRSKIRDVPAAKESDVVTLSLCQSVLILSLFRSLLKTSLALFYIHYIISTDGSKFIPIIRHYHFI